MERPRLTIAERVIRKMANGAQYYPETETGEALVGLAVPVEGRAEPDIYVLDTVAPDLSAVREGAYFELGDAWQADRFWWLKDGWERQREQRRDSYGGAVAAKWDVPLSHIGDWHKHPSGLRVPSGGDEETVRALLAEGAPRFLVVIATLTDERPSTEVREDATYHYWSGVRLTFSYMSHQNPAFMPLIPEVAEDRALPSLPRLPWHLRNTARFEAERRLIEARGFSVRWGDDREIVEPPPHDVFLLVSAPDWPEQMLFVTAPDYPLSPPHAFTLPAGSEPSEEGAWADWLRDAKQPLEDKEDWDRGRYLVEWLMELEGKV
jgi:hypothetical protein